MPYHFLDDIATADVAFRASGKTLEELFTAAAEATIHVMVEDLTQIAAKDLRSLKLQNADLEFLLVQFLQELVYYKDAEQLLLRVKKISFIQGAPGYELRCDLAGEKIDPHRHRLKVDVKAITYHQLKVSRAPQGWEATVVVDI